MHRNGTTQANAQVIATSASAAAFNALIDDVSSVVLERRDVVRGIVLGLLARQNVFLVGPPGTAKSLSVTETAARISGATCFRTLLTRFSAPEEVFGALDLNELEQGRAVRNTLGMLPQADVAFLDEIFKANSAILNSLLTALNEREFRNGPTVSRIPLVSCVGASNELPQGDDLSALYDRFMLRFFVGSLADDNSFAAMLTLGRPGLPSATVSADALRAAQAQVATIDVPTSIIADICRMRASLAADGITASDRRWRESIGILRAAAWLDGRSAVSVDDLTEYANILWSDPAERAKVQGKVLGFAAPTLRRALELLDQAAEQHRIVMRKDENTQTEAASKLRKISDEMTKLKTGAKNLRVLAAADKVVEYRKDAMNAILGG